MEKGSISKNKAKKVIRRYIKNSKTGKLIKTEIIKIDSNGEKTTTSFPAGSTIPELDIIQSAAGRRLSKDFNISTENKDTKDSAPDCGDIGPSVPANLPGLDDLLAKEIELNKNMSNLVEEKAEKKNSPKGIDESFESALITMAKKKRQKDPKFRRRGLMASTLRHDYSDDNTENSNAADNFADDTDYRNIKNVEENFEEEDKRKEKHRRRHEKRNKDRLTRKANKEESDVQEYSNNEELHPLEEAELAKKIQAAATQQKTDEKMETEKLLSPEDKILQPGDENKVPSVVNSNDENDIKKRKKKKHKHKKKKKKTKKSKKRDDTLIENVSNQEKLSLEEKGEDEIVSDFENKNTTKKLSRLNSLSTISLSSISSAFSDSFDFAEVNSFVGGGNDFDNALGEYQRLRGIRGGFRGGRGGFDHFFRGRPPYRGGRGWRGRGNFRGRGRGYDQYQGFDLYGIPPAIVTGPGRGGTVPWRGSGIWGPGWGRGFKNYEEPAGIGIYVEDDSDDSKKIKSYSSRSYSSSSYSSRSRSYRRRKRRRHRSRSRSYSRSTSRSYSSRSYSRSGRSYSRSSRSYSRSTSRSYSSSRSRSFRSCSPEKDGSMKNVYAVGERVETNKNDDDVPWWAEFDKTYEVQKQVKKSQNVTKMKDKADKEEPQANSKNAEAQAPLNVFELTLDEIYTVRCVMGLVDKVTEQQDQVEEDVKGCLNNVINEVLFEEGKQKMIHEVEVCVSDMLDQVCSDETPIKITKSSSEMLSKWNKPMLAENKILECYVKACKMRSDVEKQQKIEENTEKEQRRSENEEQKSEKRDRHGRRKKRGGRRRRRFSRSYSRSSSYSSSNSSRRQPLVSLTTEQEQSLHQAQQMLFLQQKQLQAAGILPAHLAIPTVAGIPKQITLTNVTNAVVPEPEILSNRWDKDMDVILKTKCKDDLTRKLMQRMKEKKQQEDESPNFMSRKMVDAMGSEKVFSGGASLKSRKIAFSSIEGGKLFKDGTPNPSNISEFIDGKIYCKSDLDSITAQSVKESDIKDAGKNKTQAEKLHAWSEEQRILKEEVKKKMRENIEKAERAKKEQIKEQMLEQEKQKEIMRIREEVRAQIKREIQEEIEKERKQVLDDPEMKSQLLELEALKKSKIAKVDGNTTIVDDKTKLDYFTIEQDKHKRDMNVWLEKHGRTAADMSVDEMRKMQMHYMQQLQHWGQQQQKAYMQWYWANQQHYQQHSNAYQHSSYYNQQKLEMPHPDHDQKLASSPYLNQGNLNSNTDLKSGIKDSNIMGQSHTMINKSMDGPPRYSSQHHSYQQKNYKGHGGSLYSHQQQSPSIRYHQQQQHLEYQNKISEENPHIRGQHLQPTKMPGHIEDNMHLSSDNHQGHHVYHDPNPRNNQQLQPRSQAHVRAPSFPLQQRFDSHRIPQLQPQGHPPGYQNSAKHQTVITSSPRVGEHDHPLPPGDGEAMLKPTGLSQPAPPGVEELMPPGVDPLSFKTQHEENDPPKKKKKHHKKRKELSEAEDEEIEDENKRKEIMEQLEALQTKNAEEVEDGEVKTDDDNQQNTTVEVKKKKKHKHKKKKKRRRKHSTSEEETTQHSQLIPVVTDAVTVKPHHGPSIFHDERGNSSALQSHELMFNPHSQDSSQRIHQKSYNQFVDHGANFKSHNAPQPHALGPSGFNHYMGPSGDHSQSYPARQETQPFLPPNMPDDPIELEAWAGKIDNQFHDDPLLVPHSAGPVMEQRFKDNSGQPFPPLRDVQFQDKPGNMGNSPRDFQRRGPELPRMHHPDGRLVVRERKGRPGLRRKRRRIQPRNYHDWDQPPNDGLVYYYSGSESSGWGSDTGFDDMLAKKQRETGASQPMHVTNTRRGSPAASRPDGYHLGMGEPQGIPVIGGSQPQPIPSLANRVDLHLDRGSIGRRQFVPSNQALPLFREDRYNLPSDLAPINPNYNHPSRMLPHELGHHPGGQFRHDSSDPMHRRPYGM